MINIWYDKYLVIDTDMNLDNSIEFYSNVSFYKNDKGGNIGKSGFVFELDASS